MYDFFNFAGESSEEYGLRIERYPNPKGATQRIESKPVPGRYGDWLFAAQSCGNVQQIYECYIRDEMRERGLSSINVIEMARRIRGWLMQYQDYQILWDSYDPDYFRRAVFRGPLDVQNIFNTHGRCVITFDCMPQNYLKSGEEEMEITASVSSIYNPTRYAALPLITVYGSGAGTLTIGGKPVEIKAITSGMVLDCERQDAYTASSSKNKDIHALDFPDLAPGKSQISWTGGISKIKIKPRWWTI